MKLLFEMVAIAVFLVTIAMPIIVCAPFIIPVVVIFGAFFKLIDRFTVEN